MCRNWKFWAVIAALAAGVVAITPITLSALVPLLIFAACPLMMIVGGGLAYRGARRARPSVDGRERDVRTVTSERSGIAPADSDTVASREL